MASAVSTSGPVASGTWPMGEPSKGAVTCTAPDLMTAVDMMKTCKTRGEQQNAAIFVHTIEVGPLSSGGPEGDDEGLSLVTYWPNT